MTKRNIILLLSLLYTIVSFKNLYAELSKTVEVAIFKAELISITFMTDHGVLVKELQDLYATDIGVPYEEPEWDKIQTPKPITHTKCKEIQINVKINITAKDVNFKIVGDGGADHVYFEETDKSKGSDQFVAMTSKGIIPYRIDTLEEIIDWKIFLTDPDPDVELNIGTSGPHRIYVTYGMPQGSTITEKRMKWCITIANGKKTEEDIADAIGPEAVSSKYLGNNYNTSNPWTALDSNGDCGTLATLMKRALELLGVLKAEVRFVYPCNKDWSHLCSELERANETDRYGNKLGFMMGGEWNYYEGCCFFKKKWWMGGEGTYLSSAHAVLMHVTSPNDPNRPLLNRQVWEYDTNTPVSYPKVTLELDDEDCLP